MITQALADLRATQFAAAIGKFKIHFFSGVPPTTRAALAGALSNKLITFQALQLSGGNYGITWASVTAGTGYVGRDMAQVVQGTGAATGTATWAVITAHADDLTANSAAYREMKTVGTSGAGINLASTAIVAGTVYPFASDIQVNFNDG